MYLGENIRYLRIKYGYSQDYVAEQLGYKSFTTIQKWESGVSEPPVKKLKELSTLFNVDMDELNNARLSIMDSSFEEALKLLELYGYYTKISGNNVLIYDTHSRPYTLLTTISFEKLLEAYNNAPEKELSLYSEKCRACFLNIIFDNKIPTNSTYYLNEETRQIAQEIYDNPDMRSLFDMSRKMTPERLKAHVDFMKQLYEAEHGKE